MANTLTITNSGSYSSPTLMVASPSITNLQVTVTGNGYVAGVVSLTTSPSAIPLGGLSAPFGWAFFKNLDATQTINLYDASSGHKFAQLLPGEACQLRLGTDVTAPQAAAVAGTPQLQYTLFPP